MGMGVGEGVGDGVGAGDGVATGVGVGVSAGVSEPAMVVAGAGVCRTVAVCGESLAALEQAARRRASAKARVPTRDVRLRLMSVR